MTTRTKKTANKAVPTKDPVVIAWETWVEAARKSGMLDTSTLGPTERYLSNRLWHAFMDGYRAADKANAEKV